MGVGVEEEGEEEGYLLVCPWLSPCTQLMIRFVACVCQDLYQDSLSASQEVSPGYL